LWKHYNGYCQINADGVYVVANVCLPHGATVTKCVVYGNATSEDRNWRLERIKLSDGTKVTLSEAFMNTESTAISYATVDNSLYSYFFVLMIFKARLLFMEHV